MQQFLQDVRYSLRTLMKKPGFAVAVIISLALGIGVNTTMFSVLNAVLLRALPYAQPDRLVMIWETNPQAVNMMSSLANHNQVAPANYLDWSAQNSVFESIAATRFLNFTMTGIDPPERIPGALATPNLFSTLGVQPALGRTFLPEEAQPGRARVVVLSHGLWQRLTGSSPDVIGRAITLNDEICIVIGVMPPDFKYSPDAENTEMWVTARQGVPETATTSTTDARLDRKGHYLTVVARLKPGVKLPQAQAEMSTIAQRLEQQHTTTNKGLGVRLVALHDELVGEVQAALLILFGVTGFVLLIACANVANLLLARATARSKEIALRMSLGASRWRIIRQLLTESLLLAVIGGAIGLFLTWCGTKLLVSLAPNYIPRVKEISLDTWVLGWTTLISVLTSLIFGLVPAMHASRLDLNHVLKEGGAGTAEGGGGGRLRDLLVVGEIGLTIVALIASGLLVKSFVNLLHVDPGFRTDNILTFRVSLPKSRYPAEPQMAAFSTDLLRRLQAVSGVDSVAVTSALPLSQIESAMSFTVEGQTGSQNTDDQAFANWRLVSPKYFQIMSIPILSGRDVTERDTKDAASVVLINESMARRYFPAGDALGNHLKIGGAPTASEVIGVVGDIRHSGLDIDPKPEMYVPYLQSPRAFMIVALRTRINPTDLVATVRHEVQTLDKDLPIYGIKTMDELRSESLALLRFNMLVLTLLAALALVLAGIGVHSTLAYNVSQRRHEIGIRMALGAQPKDIFKLIVGRGLFLVLCGVVVGLIGSYALTQIMANLLYGVKADDPIIFIIVSLILVAVVLLGTYLPARRATKIDPLIALRQQ